MNTNLVHIIPKSGRVSSNVFPRLRELQCRFEARHADGKVIRLFEKFSLELWYAAQPAKRFGFDLADRLEAHAQPLENLAEGLRSSPRSKPNRSRRIGRSRGCSSSSADSTRWDKTRGFG